MRIKHFITVCWNDYLFFYYLLPVPCLSILLHPLQSVGKSAAVLDNICRDHLCHNQKSEIH